MLHRLLQLSLPFPPNSVILSFRYLFSLHLLPQSHTRIACSLFNLFFSLRQHSLMFPHLDPLLLLLPRFLRSPGHALHRR